MTYSKNYQEQLVIPKNNWYYQLIETNGKALRQIYLEKGMDAEWV